MFWGERQRPVDQFLRFFEIAETEREGKPRARVAIVGRPNGGKSSIVNALLNEDRMLVEPQAGGNQKILALVPMAEMLVYANQLQSMTSGRGLYSMEFSHYEELPAHLTQKLITEREKIKEEEH